MLLRGGHFAPIQRQLCDFQDGLQGVIPLTHAIKYNLMETCAGNSRPFIFLTYLLGTNNELFRLFENSTYFDCYPFNARIKSTKVSLNRPHSHVHGREYL